MPRTLQVELLVCPVADSHSGTLLAHHSPSPAAGARTWLFGLVQSISIASHWHNWHHGSRDVEKKKKINKSLKSCRPLPSDATTYKSSLADLALLTSRIPPSSRRVSTTLATLRQQFVDVPSSKVRSDAISEDPHHFPSRYRPTRNIANGRERSRTLVLRIQKSRLNPGETSKDCDFYTTFDFGCLACISSQPVECHQAAVSDSSLSSLCRRTTTRYGLLWMEASQVVAI
ncbi:hypothetical protein B0T20DRAFT_219637 [Sordaria brevicollis]|uniref:Uncharacterized protein n=1 Tax=Sordaria brevicollis TaxID=83679 RepID=A0AAE0PFB3_SORBR|nr:hypothetical protein B0T20DRAFT_219637 [Sordaria brevicollis]